MTDKIKKVNSLEDLEKLEIGNFIKIKTFAEDEGLIFEGKIGDKYCFMQPNLPVIWSERIIKDKINFENGMIYVNNFKDIETEMYSEKDSFYKEKLNICRRAFEIKIN